MGAALHFGLGITPWSPLAFGFLTGKYQRENTKTSEQDRLSGPNTFGDSKFTDHNWAVLDALKEVATQLDCPLAQVALAWASAQPGITSPILGVSKIEQLHDNLASLEVRFTPEQLQILNEVSALSPSTPASILMPEIKQIIFGGVNVKGWS